MASGCTANPSTSTLLAGSRFSQKALCVVNALIAAGHDHGEAGLAMRMRLFCGKVG